VSDLGDKGFSGQLKFVLAFLNEVFQLEWLKLHDSSDAEALKIFSLVEIAQDIFEVEAGTLHFLTLVLTEVNQHVVIVRILISFLVSSFLFIWNHSLFDFYQNRQ
jgi:hypothetical protein